MLRTVVTKICWPQVTIRKPYVQPISDSQDRKGSEPSLQVGTWKWSQILSISDQELTWVICLNSIQFHKVAKLNLKRD